MRGYEGRTILVTGGAGSIGSNLVAALAQAGARSVIVLDDFSAACKWNVPQHPAVTVVRGSVASDPALARAFENGADVVFHLAAFFANQNSVDNPSRDLLVNGM